MVDDDLDAKFQEAFEIASNMEKKLPPDVMLRLYAYYKQAVKGDDQPSLNANISELRSAFKINAWIQLRGMDSNEAKREYIKLVQSIVR